MNHPKLFHWFVPLLLAASTALLDTTGCLRRGGHCVPGDPWYQPGHLDEIGRPDTCCGSINPCCPNPLWGRMVTDENGWDRTDLCCFFVPCPGWDPFKDPYEEPEPNKSDAGEDADESPGPTVVDAGADADMEDGAGGGP
jgi:hypothetical protein